MNEPRNCGICGGGNYVKGPAEFEEKKAAENCGSYRKSYDLSERKEDRLQNRLHSKERRCRKQLFSCSHHGRKFIKISSRRLHRREIRMLPFKVKAAFCAGHKTSITKY